MNGDVLLFPLKKLQILPSSTTDSVTHDHSTGMPVMGIIQVSGTSKSPLP